MASKACLLRCAPGRVTTQIRPLLYTREKLLRDFSYASGLPVIAENCPACFEEPKERHHIKKMLAKVRRWLTRSSAATDGDQPWDISGLGR